MNKNNLLIKYSFEWIAKRQSESTLNIIQPIFYNIKLLKDGKK